MIFNSKQDKVAFIKEAMADIRWRAEDLDKHTVHKDIPDLLVGFDTETTGFDPSFSNKGGVPIAYGITVWRKGVEQPHENESFLVNVDKKIKDENGNEHPRNRMWPGAYRVHHISPNHLLQSHHGEITKDEGGVIFNPALNEVSGTSRALSKLAQYQKEGAKFIGHNLQFDWGVLEQAHNQEYQHRGQTAPSQVFDFDKAKENSYDTWSHAKSMCETNGDQEKFLWDDGKGEGKKYHRSLDALCAKHDIPDAGKHSALQDARSAVKLYFEQVKVNKGEKPATKPLNSTPKTSSKSHESGIDFYRNGPCTGDGCDFCAHLDEVEEMHQPSGDDNKLTLKQKRHLQTVKRTRERHENIREFVKKDNNA